MSPERKAFYDYLTALDLEIEKLTRDGRLTEAAFKRDIIKDINRYLKEKEIV